MVRAVQRWIPGSERARAEDDLVPSSAAAARPVVALVTRLMATAAIVQAFNVAIVDRPICTAGAPGATPAPIARPPSGNGRVVLVPFDDFPLQDAAALAEDLRHRFALTIEVDEPLTSPADAHDPARCQDNSEVLLGALEERHPRSPAPAVAIGLTTADLYSPRVGWLYTFSWRRKPHYAVVSPARMDRGCLGVVRATPQRRLTRLRRMVGKNIGMLHYRLPLSDDPRSLMYGNVRGPQELDAMRDDF